MLLQKYNFALFSPTVQDECIPQAILGMDVICQAKSGMGKTAVFVIATLQQLEPVDGQVSVLVMCHARRVVCLVASWKCNVVKFIGCHVFFVILYFWILVTNFKGIMC